MTDTAHLAEYVQADPDLTPEERETSIAWSATDDTATIYSEERGVMPSLLRSPIATIETLHVSTEDLFRATVPVAEHSDEAVTGVTATVPIGAVLISSDPRNHSERSQVVSDHDPEE